MIGAEGSSWEFKPFRFDEWRPGQRWSFLATENRFHDYEASLVARQCLWEQIAPRVMELLQPWLDAGWELNETLGPDVFDLNKTEQIEPHFGLEDYLLGALTWTVAPLLYGVVRSKPKRFVCYTPRPFEVMMRRQVASARGMTAI